MYWTYLRRELSGRTKQTVIVATGLAIAIGLVIVVTALSAGVRDAQAQALESVYGVGTDLTVTGAQSAPGEGGMGGGPQFEFDEDDGSTDDEGTTSVSQSRLMTDFRRGTLESSAVETVTAVSGVAAASGALSLTNTTFDGELPQRPSADADAGDAGAQRPPAGDAAGGGFGGGSFDVDSFTVLGVDASDATVGPLSSVELAQGRALAIGDEGSAVAVVDETYAASSDLAVGDSLDVGGRAFEIVGIVSSASSDADTAANVYIPLDVAQELSGAGDVISTVYVQAASSDQIPAVQNAVAEALPEATVSSQSELASSVSGSLSSAGSLITSLGTWLSIIVLAAAVALAVLFTLSGVARRTQEIGTLKAIGWSNRRVVGQVAGESVAQAVIGGGAGVVLGLLGVWALNLIAPTISSAPAASGDAPGPGGALGGPGIAEASMTDIVLSAPLSASTVIVALLLAVAAGLIAGALGGWRAARLSPAEALRSMA